MLRLAAGTNGNRTRTTIPCNTSNQKWLNPNEIYDPKKKKKGKRVVGVAEPRDNTQGNTEDRYASVLVVQWPAV